MREFIATAFEAEGPEVAGIVADRLAGLGVALFDGYFLAAQIDGVEGRNRRVQDMAKRPRALRRSHRGAAPPLDRWGDVSPAG